MPAAAHRRGWDILRSRTAQEEKDSYRVDPKIEEILHYIAAHLGRS